jgi:hypothetical protein
METASSTVKQLAELAMEAEISDPIDWGLLNVSEREAFEMMASQVLEQMFNVPENERAVVAMATMTKLLVENFVLNLQLKGADNVKNGV